MLPHGSHLGSSGIQETEIVDLHHDIKSRHFGFGKVLPNRILHEKHLGLGMVDEMVDVLGLELVKNRNRNHSVCKRCEKGYTPVRLVL